MELSDLRIFLAVADTGGITRAAQEMHTGSPTSAPGWPRSNGSSAPRCSGGTRAGCR
jgi:hypothetical protein